MSCHGNNDIIKIIHGIVNVLANHHYCLHYPYLIMLIITITIITVIFIIVIQHRGLCKQSPGVFR